MELFKAVIKSLLVFVLILIRNALFSLGVTVMAATLFPGNKYIFYLLFYVVYALTIIRYIYKVFVTKCDDEHIFRYLLIF